MARVMTVRPKPRPHVIQYTLSAVAVVLAVSGLGWLWSQSPSWFGGPVTSAPSGAASLLAADKSARPSERADSAMRSTGIAADKRLEPQQHSSAAPARSADDGLSARHSAPGTDIVGSPSAPGDASPTQSQPAANAAIARALRDYASGRKLEARHELNRLLSISRDRAEQAELRGHLAQMVAETIMAGATLPNDPLVESYTVAAGDVLVKIGPRFQVPAEAVMLVNGIRNPRTIRADQRLRVPRGPFNVRITLSEMRLDVFLQDLYVRSFPIGIGRDAGTPTGEWIVKERLPNPTYYPPASAPSKRIIPPDDPANPLGEHWIGLRGVNGEAAGRNGYGIHGTIEPQSIGQAASLGCIRMHNEDVAWLYQLLLPGQSRVTILP